MITLSKEQNEFYERVVSGDYRREMMLKPMAGSARLRRYSELDELPKIPERSEGSVEGKRLDLRWCLGGMLDG